MSSHKRKRAVIIGGGGRISYYLAKMLPDVEEFREIRSFSIVKGTMFKKNKTPEQKEELFRQAMQYGIPENVINQFR